MISRRLLRIKVMQIFYARVQQRDTEFASAEKELDRSVHATLELYYEILAIITYLADHAEHKIQIAQEKKLPTYEDLHPKRNFIDNPVIEAIRQAKSFQKQTKASHIPPEAYNDFIIHLYDKIHKSETFQAYLAIENPGMGKHKQIINFIINDFLQDDPDLDQLLEEYCIYWNDDIGFVCSLLEQSIRRVKKPGNDNFLIMKEYSCEEDRVFGKQLLYHALKHNNEYEKMINDHSKNWDIERIAILDKIIMKLAITEFLHLPSIPVKVSINEYIEISKYYSTSKSNAFINGLLDQIANKLKQENRIVKTGRGLVDNI
ncbi:MAG: transcription antitermination factor NusB [Bacteroidota bacterium]|nr:transcription antitermination factor NusB [Bacteroidota bacterium]